jgi:hypothetical protein
LQPRETLLGALSEGPAEHPLGRRDVPPWRGDPNPRSGEARFDELLREVVACCDQEVADEGRRSPGRGDLASQGPDRRTQRRSSREGRHRPGDSPTHEALLRHDERENEMRVVHVAPTRFGRPASSGAVSAIRSSSAVPSRGMSIASSSRSAARREPGVFQRPPSPDSALDHASPGAPRPSGCASARSAIAGADIVHAHHLRSTPSRLAAVNVRVRGIRSAVTDHGSLAKLGRSASAALRPLSHCVGVFCARARCAGFSNEGRLWRGRSRPLSTRSVGARAEAFFSLDG